MYITNQIGYCCALVAAVNALIYHKKPYPSLQSAEFEALVKLTKCNEMPCVNLRKMWHTLGIKPTKIFFDKRMIMNNLPVECSVVHKDYSYHSVLIVGADDFVLEVVGFYKNQFTWVEFEKYLPVKSIRIVRVLNLVV